MTSSNATSGGASTGAGIPPTRIDRVVAVLKAFTTRVGEGPFPTELHDATGDYLREVGHEYGTTTGRPRRIGWLDLVMGRYAQRINGVTDFVLTKLDNYDGLDEIPVCVAYEVNGVRHDEMPVNQSDFHHAIPIYETLPGWKKDITGCRTFDDLPENAQQFVEFVEARIGARISVVGVGPGRDEVIERHSVLGGAVYDVVVLSLAEGAPAGGLRLGAVVAPARRRRTACAPRVPVLACADALTAAGARVEMVSAGSDAEIDEVLARLDGPARADGLDWPDADSKTRLVVATATDGQLRAVVRRLVRRYAPPPSRRPADLAANRTVPDLPPIAILPLDPAGSSATGPGRPARPAPRPRRRWRRPCSTARCGGSTCCATTAARSPWTVRCSAAPTTTAGRCRGGAGSRWTTPCSPTARTRSWPARSATRGGYAEFDGLPLLADGDPTDGRVEVAVAVPVLVKQRFRGTRVRMEVRRARGRAVSVLPRDGELQFLDDGVAGSTSRKRSWWTEPGAWAVYAGDRSCDSE